MTGNQKGAALVEFAISSTIFFLFIFGIFEIGLMISIRTGLDAATFYATREAIAGKTKAQVTTIFTQNFQKYSYVTDTNLVLTVTDYPNLTALYNNTSGTPWVSNQPNRAYRYQSSYPYMYITSLLAPSGTIKNVTLNRAVLNENY